MREVFIITPAKFSISDLFSAANETGWSPIQGDGVVAFRKGDHYVDAREMPDLAEHYDDFEQEEIRECGPEPRFFRVRFDDYKVAARMILTLFPASPEFALDNDHGLILSLDRFAALRPTDWDWTTAAGPQ